MAHTHDAAGRDDFGRPARSLHTQMPDPPPEGLRKAFPPRPSVSQNPQPTCVGEGEQSAKSVQTRRKTLTLKLWLRLFSAAVLPLRRRHVTYAKSLFLLKHASVKIVMCRAERGSRAGEEFT